MTYGLAAGALVIGLNYGQFIKESNDPSILFFPVMTNAVSGLIDTIYRHIKKKSLDDYFSS